MLTLCMFVKRQDFELTLSIVCGNKCIFYCFDKHALVFNYVTNNHFFLHFIKY